MLNYFFKKFFQPFVWIKLFTVGNKIDRTCRCHTTYKRLHLPHLLKIRMDVKKKQLKNNHEQNIHLFPSCFFDKVKLRTKRDLLFGTGQKRKQISISNILWRCCYCFVVWCQVFKWWLLCSVSVWQNNQALYRSPYFWERFYFLFPNLRFVG